MKALCLLICLMVFFAAAPAFAGKPVHTGDAGWDRSLSRLNTSAHADAQIYTHRIAVHFDIDQGTVAGLMQRPGFSAADVSVALKLSSLTGKPVNEIVQLYETEPGRGWGELAKSLGIKPSSRKFHALKNDSRDFMDYWQGKGKKGKAAGKQKNKTKKEKNKSAKTKGGAAAPPF